MFKSRRGHFFMYKTDPLLIEKCRILRRKGFTLGEIIKATKLPKTTVYDHISDIILPLEVKVRINNEARRRINEYIKRERKGKCIPGRIIIKPKGWTKELIFLIAHFMFDGEIRHSRCVYQNRNITLINLVKQFMEDIFNLTPYYKLYRETGVHRISYHYVELADYIKKKAQGLKKYIKTASLPEKEIFLQVFFDDEGCAYQYGNNRKLRGYQHNLEILNLIKELLKDFDIKSRIEEKGREIVISGKENLIKFRDKINFSKGIYINPNRKNSIWKKKLEKREILDRIISSYKN